ncbi:hypothetical protein D9M69_712260 [compost metagenome]
MGTAHGVGRQQRRLGVHFVEVFDDGHRLREALALVFEQRHEHVGRDRRERTGAVFAARDVHGHVVVVEALQLKGDAHAERGGGSEIVMQLHGFQG